MIDYIPPEVIEFLETTPLWKQQEFVQNMDDACFNFVQTFRKQFSPIIEHISEIIEQSPELQALIQERNK